MTTVKAMVFSILRICAPASPFSSPEVCHNQTDPLPGRAVGHAVGKCVQTRRGEGAGSRPAGFCDRTDEFSVLRLVRLRNFSTARCSALCRTPLLFPLEETEDTSFQLLRSIALYDPKRPSCPLGQEKLQIAQVRALSLALIVNVEGRRSDDISEAPASLGSFGVTRRAFPACILAPANAGASGRGDPSRIRTCNPRSRNPLLTLSRFGANAHFDCAQNRSTPLPVGDVQKSGRVGTSRARERNCAKIMIYAQIR
jgi:hypothetical protein